jgi:hypothetical protein
MTSARITTPGRGDPSRVRTIGTGHLILALLIDPASPTVDPASPASEALGCDLGAACRALDELDNQSLAAIGVEPGITATPVAVRASRRLRLTPAARASSRAFVTPQEPRCRPRDCAQRPARSASP